MRDAIERLSREFANNILRVIADTAAATIKAPAAEAKPRGMAALSFEKRQEVARRAAQTRKRRASARKGAETRKAKKTA